MVDQDTSKAKSMGMHLLKRDLATVDGEKIRHNPDAIAASIVELICEDLKFKDMQNNPEYMILNDELKTQKKGIRARRKSKFNNNNISGNNKEEGSAFANKYKERITSIKESDKEKKNKSKKATNVMNVKNQILGKSANVKTAQNSKLDDLTKRIIEIQNRNKAKEEAAQKQNEAKKENDASKEVRARGNTIK